MGKRLHSRNGYKALERTQNLIIRSIIRDLNFRCSLTQVRPLVTTGVGEPVGHRTVGAVDDARRSWMLDAGHGFFIWVNSLRDEPEGLVPRLFTEDL